jgi:phospholipase C
MRTLIAFAALVFALPASARAPKCSFGPGDLPAVTARNKPHGPEIPINTIVVLMQENRSFDHYLGRLHFQGQRRTNAEPGNASNPDPTNPSGPPVRPFLQMRLCEIADLDHSWNGTHQEWDNGAMDGFTAANVDPNDPTGARTMGYYDQGTLPFYYALYSTFAMADRYFASVLTQTFPNRFYLLTGTSFGHIRNDFASFTQPTIFELLDQAGVSWKIYHSGLPFGFLFQYVLNHQANVVPVNPNYFADAAAGTLPQVSFIDPIFIGAKNVENDEHPPANVQVGEKFAADTINAFMASPQWSNGAFFLTYDEHGGFYDHVPPPQACVPDGIPPMLQTGDVTAGFDNYGIRVPFVVVSPFARKHYVSHKVYDHTSILRFIETRFDLPALTKRDANADALLRLFRFKKASFATPPTLPAAPVDLTRPECSPSGAFLELTSPPKSTARQD